MTCSRPHIAHTHKLKKKIQVTCVTGKSCYLFKPIQVRIGYEAPVLAWRLMELSWVLTPLSHICLPSKVAKTEQDRQEHEQPVQV